MQTKTTALKLPALMPNGKTTRAHPLTWCLENQVPVGDNLSSVARHMGVRPQSLYKWMRKCEADRHFSLPALRAKQLGSYFAVPPALFRPDLY